MHKLLHESGRSKHMLVIVDSTSVNIKVGTNVPCSLECTLGQSMPRHPRSLDLTSPSQKLILNKYLSCILSFLANHGNNEPM